LGFQSDCSFRRCGHPLGITEDRDDWIVRHKDHLSARLHFEDRFDDRFGDESVVEIVLRLVD
jgi:hypothetical protein